MSHFDPESDAARNSRVTPAVERVIDWHRQQAARAAQQALRASAENGDGDASPRRAPPAASERAASASRTG